MSEERKPLYKIEMYVDEHVSKEPSNPDKPDTFEILLKAPKRSLKIGLEDAEAKMKIKALDDVIKHQFPHYGNFLIEIYPLKKAVKIDVAKPTQQSPLPA